MTLEEARLFLGDHLGQIAEVLPREYKLTLIARNTSRPNADIVVTDDDVLLSTKAARKLLKAPAYDKHGERCGCRERGGLP